MTRPDGARFGKPDKTGRSSGNLQGKWRNTVNRPPKGEPFIWLTRELLTSDAWKAQSKLCRRFIDFLHIEHMNHAGTMNGHLKATYDQLQRAGISRRWIKSVIDEAEALGLVCVQRGGPWWKPNRASTYTLTYYAVDDTPAENRWKQPNIKAAEASVSSRSKINPGTTREALNQYHPGGTAIARLRDAEHKEHWDSSDCLQYHPSGTSSISTPTPSGGFTPGGCKKLPWTKPAFVDLPLSGTD